MKQSNPILNVLSLSAEIDKTIHEPARLMIMSMLYVIDRADFVFLLNQTGLTRGNLSTHLSKLEEEGFITAHKEFIGKKPASTYAITKSGRKALEDYRSLMKKILAELE